MMCFDVLHVQTQNSIYFQDHPTEFEKGMKEITKLHDMRLLLLGKKGKVALQTEWTSQ